MPSVTVDSIFHFLEKVTLLFMHGSHSMWSLQDPVDLLAKPFMFPVRRPLRYQQGVHVVRV